LYPDTPDAAFQASVALAARALPTDAPKMREQVINKMTKIDLPVLHLL